MKTLRRLARTPWFSASVILLFGLGVGANAAILGALHTLYVRALPLPDGDRLVRVAQAQGDGSEAGVRPMAPGNFLDLRGEATSFSGLVSYFVQPQVVVDGETAVRIDVADVSRDFFTVLGSRAVVGPDGQRGRLDVPLTANGAPDILEIGRVVLSESLWRTRFGARSVAGERLQIDGQTVEVVGVVSAESAIPPEADAWQFMPRDVAELNIPGVEDATTLRDARYLGVIGRLAPGAELEGARAELREFARRLEKEYPEANRDLGFRIDGLASTFAGNSDRPLRLLGAAGVAVLSLVCLNLAGLFLARSAQRERDIAVRSALGASPAQLRRELMGESLLLAAFGGVLGLTIAAAGSRFLLRSLPGVELAGRDAGLGFGALGAAALLAAVSGVAAGLVPAWRAARIARTGFLAGSRAGLSRHNVALRRGLVSAQSALALLLLVAAVLLTRSLQRLESARLGIEPGGAWSARLTLPSADSTLTRQLKRELMSRAAARVAELPGVEMAGATTRLPFSDCGPSSNLRVEGRVIAPADQLDTCWRAQLPGTLQALGARVIAGRDLAAGDRDGAPEVALVNATLARWLVGGVIGRDGVSGEVIGEVRELSAALGMRIGTGLDGESTQFATVVGVLDDMPQLSPEVPTLPEIHRPWAQARRWGTDTIRVVARGAVPTERALAAALAEVSPRLAIDEFAPLEHTLRAATARSRLLGGLLAAFAAMAVLLAAIGLHGLVALLVVERRRELGVRLALGSNPRQLVRRVFAWGLQPMLAGAAVGLGLAFAGGRLMAGFLYGVSSADATSFLTAFLALAGAAFLACVLPARRAARTEPADVLRGE